MNRDSQNPTPKKFQEALDELAKLKEQIEMQKELLKERDRIVKNLRKQLRDNNL